MMTPDQIIEVVTAFRDGKKIQYRPIRGLDEWLVSKNPKWEFQIYEYRVKQEPLKLYALIDESGALAFVSRSKQTLEGMKYKSPKIREFSEVPEDEQ